MVQTPLTMAFATPIVYSSGVNSTSQSKAVSRDIPAGHTLILFGAFEGSGGVMPTVTVTDAAGNTATANAQQINSTTRQVFICALPITTQLNSGQNVTVAISPGRQEWVVNAFECSGLASSPADQTAVNAASSNPMSGGTTGTTTQAEEIVFGAFATGPGVTITGSGSYTLAGAYLSGSGAGHHQVSLGYQVVHATGAYAAALSEGATGAYAGVTLTVKAAAVQTVRPASDDTTTGWAKTPSGAASFAANNNDQDDTTYNRLTTPDGSHPLVEVLGNPGTTPPTGASCVLRVRARVNSASSATGVLSIIQGSTTRASATVTLAVDGQWGWYELTLNSTQVAAIAGGAGGWNGLKASFSPTAS